MIFCPIGSYASVFLLSKNFTNGSIGWVMAASNIIAVFLQPALGSLIDRNKKITVKSALYLLTILSLLMLAGMIFVNLGLWWIAISYIGIMALLITIQPLVNSLTFEAINAGYPVNFGLTRAMGSISFAVISPLLGLWIGHSSTAILPVIGSILYIGFLILTLLFPKIEPSAATLANINNPAEENKIEKNFLKRYPRFLLFLLGIALLFLFHTIINTYLAQITTSLGGNDTDIGILLAIAAVCELPALLGFNFLLTRFNNSTLLKASGVFYALRGFVFLFATTQWMIAFGQVLQGISFAVLLPASVYYVNKLMRNEDKVKGQTLITGAMTLGSVFGSVLGGKCLDLFGVPAMLILGSVSAVLGCMILWRAIQRPKKNFS